MSLICQWSVTVTVPGPLSECSRRRPSPSGTLGCYNTLWQNNTLDSGPLTTRSKSLPKMLRIVQNERFTTNFTFEIDSESSLLNSTWNSQDTTSSAFQFSTVQWLASEDLKQAVLASLVYATRVKILKFVVVSRRANH